MLAEQPECRIEGTGSRFSVPQPRGRIGSPRVWFGLVPAAVRLSRWAGGLGSPGVGSPGTGSLQYQPSGNLLTSAVS